MTMTKKKPAAAFPGKRAALKDLEAVPMRDWIDRAEARVEDLQAAVEELGARDRDRLEPLIERVRESVLDVLAAHEAEELRHRS